MNLTRISGLCELETIRNNNNLRNHQKHTESYLWNRVVPYNNNIYKFHNSSNFDLSLLPNCVCLLCTIARVCVCRIAFQFIGGECMTWPHFHSILTGKKHLIMIMHIIAQRLLVLRRNSKQLKLEYLFQLFIGYPPPTFFSARNHIHPS